MEEIKEVKETAVFIHTSCRTGRSLKLFLLPVIVLASEIVPRLNVSYLILCYIFSAF